MRTWWERATWLEKRWRRRCGDTSEVGSDLGVHVVRAAHKHDGGCCLVLRQTQDVALAWTMGHRPGGGDRGARPLHRR